MLPGPPAALGQYQVTFVCLPLLLTSEHKCKTAQLYSLTVLEVKGPKGTFLQTLQTKIKGVGGCLPPRALGE